MMSELAQFLMAIGVSGNTAAIVAAFWLIDRRLVKIETMMHARSAREFSPCPLPAE